jgi:hypothetical protein
MMENILWVYFPSFKGNGMMRIDEKRKPFSESQQLRSEKSALYLRIQVGDCCLNRK